MNKREIVLAALAAGDGERHDPVEMQKMMFLIDRKIPDDVDGPHFEFKPYNYGPFDKTVYEELEAAAVDGFVEIVPTNRWSEYALTERGLKEGRTLLDDLPDETQNYLRTLSDFVRSLSFEQLVSVIYRNFPEMRENSVFEEDAAE